MELKKTKRANVYRKRGLYFCIGLMVSISLAITAFEWRFEEKPLSNFEPVDTEPETILEMKITKIEPPPPPIPQPPKLVIIEDSKEADELTREIFNIETNENEPIPIPEFLPPSPEKPVEKVFLIVEENASFQGGQKAYAKFLRKNLKYPKVAQRMRIEGKVHVQFIINKDGSITDVKVLKGIGGGCDEEAVRVINNSPKWNPGKQRGRPVRQRMVIPIVFQLN